MARRTIVQMIDDLTGDEADETVKFAIDGTQYEIDLSSKNAAKIREALAPFVSAGTKLGRVATATYHRPAARVNGSTNGYRRTELLPSGQTRHELNAQIRAWAEEKGLPVSDRGRIRQEIQNAYTGRDGADAEVLLKDAYTACNVAPPAPAVESPAPRQRAVRKKTTPAATFTAAGK